MKGTTLLLYRLQFFQLQLEGGYDPLIYRLQPEGSLSSLDFLAPSYHPDMKIKTELLKQKLH